LSCGDLTDEELREQLQSQDTILFVGECLRWQEIERQAERLGFGELYRIRHTRAALKYPHNQR
jgi:hypothetical protein